MKKKFEEKKEEIAKKKKKGHHSKESREDEELDENERGGKDGKRFPSKDEKECAKCGSKKHKTMEHKGYND